jgi:hypothetical protein
LKPSVLLRRTINTWSWWTTIAAASCKFAIVPPQVELPCGLQAANRLTAISILDDSRKSAPESANDLLVCVGYRVERADAAVLPPS